MMGYVETLPASVLVIENHPMMREALWNAIAEETDLKVIESRITAKESVTISIMDDVLFLPTKPDIILLTLGNPGQEELKVLKALCKCLPFTPIMALTSNEVEGQEEAALEAGARAVLTKAASRSEIIDALREIHRKNSIHYQEEISKQEVGGNTFQ
jgi:DNA-binding NarL/FixJ family response regulator